MIGASLGPYRIDRELGAGGMGKVYAATLTREAAGLAPGTIVALKVVHPHLLEAEGFFRRFLQEAQIGASIQHENVVRTYLGDALASGGVQHNFLVMEHVEGQTLADLQRELDRVPEELCRHVAREICKGLAAIHEAGVVHRDLKPENVLITPDHVVKVMDLGVARLADEQLRLSQTGAFIGSVEYAAPEQFGGEVDHRCDLHSLGLLLYELSCGQHPYRADSFPEVMRKVREDAPRRLGEVNPQLSVFFEEVVHTLLAKDRDERFADASELLAVLEEGEDSDWWHQRASVIRRATKRPLRRIRIPRETAVYGREKELARLRDLYDRAKLGEGQVILIEGEAGIGKSRLVDELIGRLQQSGEDLNFLFGSYPPSGAAMAEGGFSTAYREQFGEAGSAAYLPDTPLLVPAFDALLTGHPPPNDALKLTRDSIGTCFVHATRNLAAERPTVVLADDLHFAPEEARGLFTALALADPRHPVLLVGTMRPGVPEDWVANVTRVDHASRMELTRLGPKDLAGLLEDSFGSVQLADELGMKIVRKSDGNPFFVFEIIRGLREGQFITRKDDGTWVSTRQIEDIQIPSSVLDLVNARVADVSEDEHNLLDVAACLGFEFDPSLVGSVLGMGRIPTLQAFGRIEKRHRLARSAGRNYVFDHHQVQEALYGGLNEQLREEYHAALAEALETRESAAAQDPETLDGALCVALCDHYLAGGRGESALRYLRSARLHLAGGYLHAQAVDLFERALAVPGLLEGVERARALLSLADSGGPLDTLGRRHRQETCAREAQRLAEEAGDARRRAWAAEVLGWCLCWVSRYAEAEAESRRVIEFARTIADKKWEASATGLLGVICFTDGRLTEAREHHERALALARESGARGTEAAAIGNLGNVFQGLDQLVEAKVHYEQTLALSRELGNRQYAATSTGNLGAVYANLGRLAEAREHDSQALTLSRAIGFRYGEVIALQNLGSLLVAEGKPADGEERLLESLALGQEITFRHMNVGTRLELGLLFTDTGRHELAREHLVAARDVALEIGHPGGLTLARCRLALLPGGDAQDALEAFAQQRERLDASWRRPARLLLYQATGDRAHLAEAKRLLDDLLAKNPPEYHESMCTNVRVNREILAACRTEFGDEGDAPDGASPGESPTRSG